MKNIRTTFKSLSVGLTLLFVLSACSSKEFVKPGDPLDVAFEKSMELFERGDYRDAADAFQIVINSGRGTEFGREAQFYLAESYFNDELYLQAASEYERYSTLYPRSDRIEEVDFKEALCYYKMSPRYKLDQQYSRTAIDKFRLFNNNYPNSDRREEAVKYISELRSKLAHKHFSAAQLYMRTDQYKAATIYYDMIVDNYPETKWAERALVNEIEAYVIYADHSIEARQKERYTKAVETYETYLQLFPQGPNRSKAETYVDEARVALAKLDKAADDTTSQSTSND